MKDITLRTIRNIDFSNIYEKLMTQKNLTNEEQLKILEIAIIFINSCDVYVKQLGYRIIVIYSIQYNNYEPLYEIAVNQGLYHISHFIDAHLTSESRKNIFTEINESYSSNFKRNGIYQSEEQYNLCEYFQDNLDQSVSIVAPTSYGKTDLILDTIRLNINKKICIVTPTKSLLAQTRKRILSAKINGIQKIVVTPEMFNPNDSSCVSVLTQERLLRLLKDAPNYSFDFVIVDEAHDMLNDDKRNELLACVIMILNKRNPNASFKFLTPFINNINNLKVRYTSYGLSSYTIKEYVKTERIYVYDIIGRSGLHFYDQFFDEWYVCSGINKNLTDVGFLWNYMAEKNIVYFNKPVDIESFAKKLLSYLPDIILPQELSVAIKHISDYVSPDYTLVKCIKKGFLYHHGSIPDAIRQYIEHLYSSINEIRFVLTSSTLLEGVNLPAEKMFIFDNRKGKGNLTSSHFKNLIGRICRFSEIFDENKKSLKGLAPEVYLVFSEYFMKNSNYKSFVSKVMKVDKKHNDDCQNVLLEETNLNKKDHLQRQFKQAKEFVENYESGIIENYSERTLKTKIGKYCIQNNIKEFDIFEHEAYLQDYIDFLKKQNKEISNCDQLVDLLEKVFVELIDEEDIDNLNILRFKNESTRNYYSTLLNSRITNESYSQMINKTVSYWEYLVQKKLDTFVYVGKWGDSTRNNGHLKYWTDISLKKKSEKINLAIVRIKEEQDFIDNVIMKFVEVFHDVDLIDESFYKKIKYGTDNTIQIVLAKNGFSMSLSKLIIDKYIKYVDININANTVVINPNLINSMIINKENDILIFEAKNNI